MHRGMAVYREWLFLGPFPILLLGEIMTAKQVLKKALKHLETKGWCQGTFHNTKGEACLVGAIYAGAKIPTALGGDTTDYNAVNKAVEKLGFNEQFEVIAWNDRKRRRFADVKARITKALEA